MSGTNKKTSASQKGAASKSTSAASAKRSTSGKSSVPAAKKNVSASASRKTSSAPAGRKTSSAKTASSSAHKAVSAQSGRKKLTTAQRRELERQQRITQLLIIVGSIMVAFIILMVFLILSDKQQNKADYTATASTANTSSQLAAGVYPASKEYTKAPDGEQLKKPAAGEEVAVLETSMGTIRIRLFPDYVPTAVENFKTLIQKGYYNGITFHRVMNDFMIQSGDPTGTGRGGECAFEGYNAFEDEFGRNLYNIRGALSMANAGTNTNGSQFFIVQTKVPQYSTIGNAENFVTYGGAQWAADAYEKYGGTPYLDGEFKEKGINRSGHTVFGQVYEGMDVVDKIAAVETDPETDKPLKDVTIKRAYLEKVK